LTAASICAARSWASQQVAKPQDGALVGKPADAAGQLRKLAVQRRVKQRLFHRRIGQTKPLLQEVDAQHGLNRKRRPAGLAFRVVRFNQRNQVGPGNHTLHLVEKLALARLLDQQLQAKICLRHRRYRFNNSDRPSTHRHADSPTYAEFP